MCEGDQGFNPDPTKGLCPLQAIGGKPTGGGARLGYAGADRAVNFARGRAAAAIRETTNVAPAMRQQVGS